MFGDGAVFHPDILATFKLSVNPYIPQELNDYNICYIAFGPAVEEVLNHQKELSWNPRIPLTEMAALFLGEVKANLVARNKTHLRLYRAVGTRLDFYHGIDGFFEFKGMIFTFNLKKRYGKITSRHRKKEKRNVDLYLYKRKPIDPRLSLRDSFLHNVFKTEAPYIAAMLEQRDTPPR